MAEIIDTEMIINELQHKGIIHLTKENIDRKKGTTEGQVYILYGESNKKYVLKIDKPENISYTERFLHMYEEIYLLPKIIFTDSNKKFILYTFIEGETHLKRGSKIQWMTCLARDFINNYKKCSEEEEWGRLGLPRKSWHEFNTYSVKGAYKNLNGILLKDDYMNVMQIVNELSKGEKEEEKHFLHGDTGIHNFVFRNEILRGVIDPSPIVGPVLYDFTYAFCSSPDDLETETLFEAFSHLNNVDIENSRIVMEVIVQLYTRIGVCAKVHPQDLEEYLVAWRYWKDKIQKCLF